MLAALSSDTGVTPEAGPGAAKSTVIIRPRLHPRPTRVPDYTWVVNRPSPERWGAWSVRGPASTGGGRFCYSGSTGAVLVVVSQPAAHAAASVGPVGDGALRGPVFSVAGVRYSAVPSHALAGTGTRPSRTSETSLAAPSQDMPRMARWCSTPIVVLTMMPAR